MSFDDMMSAARRGPEVNIENGWGQGRSSFGGLNAAVLLARMFGELETPLPLRSFNVSFVGPVSPGGAAVQANVLRAGKSVTHVEARLIKGSDTQTVGLASFGAPRASAVNWAPAPERPVGPREKGQVVTYVPKLMPEFLQHFDLVSTEGGVPYSGHKRPDFAGYMRHHARTSPFTWEALVALIDVWPLGVMPMLKAPAPASSMTWAMEFMGHELPTDPTAWWQYRVQTDHAADGYGHQVSHIHDSDGRLFAISRQVVTVFG